MTIAEADQTTRAVGYDKNDELKERASWLNNRAMKSRIGLLLKHNPRLRLAFYGGVDHNNCNSPAEVPGGYLKKKLGKQYFEIDLFPTCERNVTDRILGSGEWEKQVSPETVVSVKKGNTRTIFFPCKK
jgi:hypothetical protein